MVDIASLELCQELYALTGGKLSSDWGSTYFYYTPNNQVAHGWYINPGGGTAAKEDIPAYSLGYLLRKLPHTTAIMHGPRSQGEWEAYFVSVGHHKARRYYADTPENAATKLAIELIKQGILNPKQETHA